MVSKAALRQRGSSVSFLLVGIVLVVLVAGGIYALKGHNGGSTEPAKPEGISKGPAESSSAPVTTKTPHESKSSSPSKEKTPTSRSTEKNSSKRGSLPATGPSDIVAETAILAILAGVAVSYIQSRRAVTETFRR